MPEVCHIQNEEVASNKGGQRDFLLDFEHYICALQGGWGSGKTWAGARKLIGLHAFNAFDAEGNLTGVPSIVVAPTYANAMDFCVPMLEEALDECDVPWTFRGPGPIANGRFYGPALICHSWGTEASPSIILIRTADTPERITGFEVGAAWGDEVARWRIDRIDPLKNAMLQLKGRVRHKRARIKMIVFTYTNEGDNTMVFKEMHGGFPDRVLYTASTKENPVVEEFYNQHIKTLTKELIKQYLHGEAASFRGGRVYSQYDVNTNVDNSLMLTKGVPLQLSVDFNIAPGMHGLIGQHDKSRDKFFCVYEIHQPRLSVQGMITELDKIIKLNGGWWRKPGVGNWPILEVYGDATGSSAWAGTGQSNYEILKLALDHIKIPYRLKVPKANPLIIDRINAFNVALRDVSGEIHWVCHPRCQRIMEDLQDMSWNEWGEFDQADKKLGHASDAEGYKVWWIRPARTQKVTVGGRFGFTSTN